jgi:hypothetical protein
MNSDSKIMKLKQKCKNYKKQEKEHEEQMDIMQKKNELKKTNDEKIVI